MPSIIASERNLFIVSKAGRLRSGSDNNWKRPIWHYSERDPQGNGFDYPALCGAQPHIMWSDARQYSRRMEVTCKKCLKLAKAMETA